MTAPLEGDRLNLCTLSFHTLGVLVHITHAHSSHRKTTASFPILRNCTENPAIFSVLGAMPRTTAPAMSLVKLAGDFTLGFADGLTVPFALTAGMSFLGRADAVILAGLAELCAGSISMGIGGFLAMRDTQREQDRLSTARHQEEEREEGCPPPSSRRAVRIDDRGEDAATGLLSEQDDGTRSSTSNRSSGDEDFSDEKAPAMQHQDAVTDAEAVRRHLAPLQLPESTIQHVLVTMQRPSRSHSMNQPTTPSAAQTPVQRRLSTFYDSYRQSSQSIYRNACVEEHHTPVSSKQQSAPLAPFISGLTIALGYVIGGLIPLLPYFFAGSVDAGMRWSIALCMIALFGFGSGKYWLLQSLTGAGEEQLEELDGSSSGVLAKRLRSCLFEGVQMLVLGMVAAGAAVLCVQLVNEHGSST